jgi:hypothetical protein
MRYSEGPGDGHWLPRSNPDSWMQDAEQAPRTTRNHDVAWWFIASFMVASVLLLIYVVIFA